MRVAITTKSWQCFNIVFVEPLEHLLRSHNAEFPNMGVMANKGRVRRTFSWKKHDENKFDKAIFYWKQKVSAKGKRLSKLLVIRVFKAWILLNLFTAVKETYTPDDHRLEVHVWISNALSTARQQQKTYVEELYQRELAIVYIDI